MNWWFQDKEEDNTGWDDLSRLRELYRDPGNLFFTTPFHPIDGISEENLAHSVLDASVVRDVNDASVRKTHHRILREIESVEDLPTVSVARKFLSFVDATASYLRETSTTFPTLTTRLPPHRARYARENWYPLLPRLHDDRFQSSSCSIDLYRALDVHLLPLLQQLFTILHVPVPRDIFFLVYELPVLLQHLRAPLHSFLAV